MGIKMRLNSGERVNAALFIAERSVACGFQAAALPPRLPPPSQSTAHGALGAAPKPVSRSENKTQC